MKLRDLDKYAIDPTVTYGGSAGQKVAIRMDGALWMVKYPESTKGFPNKKGHLPSHTTSPLSEYIGSHVYESLGIPVHETLLGVRDGKVVVACKDFVNGGSIIDFASIKNSVSEDDLLHGTSSSPHGDYLTDVLRVIAEAPIFEGMRDEVRTRFWDMFVTDAFILNNDRNNGNWGLVPLGRWPVLGPVYDNGQSFFNKKGVSVMERQLAESDSVWNNVAASVSFYLTDDGHAIKPFEFLARTDNPDARKALERFVERIDPERVDGIIEDIPEQYRGFDVLPQAARDFYLQAAHASLAQGIMPAAERQQITAGEK